VRLTSQNGGPQVNVRVDGRGGDDAVWRKLLTRPTELSGSPASRDIWEEIGGMNERVRIFHVDIWDTSTNF
jgi:hypothetical protein